MSSRLLSADCIADLPKNVTGYYEKDAYRQADKDGLQNNVDLLRNCRGDYRPWTKTVLFSKWSPSDWPISAQISGDIMFSLFWKKIPGQDDAGMLTAADGFHLEMLLKLIGGVFGIELYQRYTILYCHCRGIDVIEKARTGDFG
jgi:hypothetical protein